MAHTVAVGTFEGPLGMLLELVERGRVEVTAISVAAVTSSYLEKVQGLDGRSPEEMSDFLQLGARLLYIKSLALLPQSNTEEQADELRQLNIELTEYRRFQQAARWLGRRQLRTWTRPEASRPPAHPTPTPSIDLPMLAEAFARALRSAPPVPEKGVIRAHISLETMMAHLQTRLAKGSFELQTALDENRNRLELMLMFLALLELIRGGSVRVSQTSQFAPIIIEATHA